MLENLRAPFKRLIEPIAQLCVKLGLTANTLTVIGAIGTVLVAFAAGLTGWLFAGAFLLTLLVLFDSLDGSVAKLQGGGTRFGAFLDSSLDRIADWAVIVAVIIYCIRLDNAETLWPQLCIWSSLVAIMTSFVTSYVRARGQSIGVDPKLGVATRADRLTIILVAMAVTGLGAPVIVLSLGMVLLAILGVITVIQRIVLVYHNAQ